MPIVSHITQSNTQADDSKSVVVRYYDQDGREYMISFFAGVGVDVETIINNRIADMDEQLALSEFEQIVGLG
jgi:hypothetical protein